MALAVTVVVDDVEWNPAQEETFRREVRRLERALERLRIANADLVATVRSVAGGSTLLRLELTHAKTPVRVHRVVPHVRAGLSVVFDTLVANLVGGTASRNAGAEAVAAVYPAFAWFARREVGIAESEASHAPGTIDADDLAEAVVEEVMVDLDAETPPEQVLERLQAALRARLRAEEADLEARQDLERPLADPVRVPLSVVFDQQGEAADAWWPEEGASYADRLPDPDAGHTEDALADHEHRARLVRALFQLEPRARRNWAEVLLDGWAVDAAAAAQGRTEADLRRELDASRAFLAEKLGVTEDDVEGEYRALGERYRDEVPELRRRAS